MDLNDSPANVIDFRPKGTLEVTPRRKDPMAGCASRCRHVYADEKRRVLECRECGQIIEPFEYIWRLAQSGSHFMREVDRLDGEVRAKRAQVSTLDAQIRANKSTLRRQTSRLP